MFCEKRTIFTETTREGCITESIIAMLLASGLLRIIFPHESEALDTQKILQAKCKMEHMKLN